MMLTALLRIIVALTPIIGVKSLAFAPQKQFELPTLFKLPLTKKSTFSYTHLECNGQLWKANNGNTAVSIVIDPIASQLDFGIPWGYRANKLSLSEQATIDIICEANPTHCLLTQGLDDHTHLPTLAKLCERLPGMKYIVAESCEKKLLDFGLSADQITVLDHGESCNMLDGAQVTATQGALVGPPWQKREIGFLLQLNDSNSDESEEEGLSIYYEPHADVILDNIRDLKADIMVSPVTKQSLPAQVPTEGQFTLVYGGDRALEIAETLGVDVIIPLGNGALNTDGPLAGLVSTSGTISDFEKLVEQRNIGRDDAMKVVKSTPGVSLKVSL